MSKCPFHQTEAPPLEEGAEMCSHARRKLEAQKQQQQQQQQQDATDAKRCSYSGGSQKQESGSATTQEGATTEASQKCPHSPSFFKDKDWRTATNDEFKEFFTLAYDDAAAHTKNLKNKNDVAAILMEKLGYTHEQLEIIGEDVLLMQGTGNPHALASLQPGERVVDLGSGFGLDALLASSKVGRTGRVTGIDLSAGEVTSALKRISERRVRNVDFRIGDIEDQPFFDGSADAVISNGGFCLVPDKRKAFSEIYRVLRPGGRFSISCTTRIKELDMSLDWPSCMIVFMPLDIVWELLTSLGFVDIEIDDKNGRMDLWDEAKSEAGMKQDEGKGAKLTIHRGDSRFDFLKSMDMNEFFARVNISARKPQ